MFQKMLLQLVLGEFATSCLGILGSLPYNQNTPYVSVCVCLHPPVAVKCSLNFILSTLCHSSQYSWVSEKEEEH